MLPELVLAPLLLAHDQKITGVAIKNTIALR
jgi:hypothetical protein